jgi:hypothetical protein
VLQALGHALAGQEKWAAAHAAYQEALAIRRELGEQALVMETLASLARLHLAQEDPASAQPPVREILDYLDAGSTLDGADEPFRIYWTCYQTLRANDDPRARAVLATTYQLLQARADQLSDDASRRSFLEQVPHHREILEEEKRITTNSLGYPPDSPFGT